MPKAWTAKDERQYEHVKKSELDTGRSTKRAKQIAAATVNKNRAAEGRTEEQRGGGKARAKRPAKSRSRS